MGEMSILILEVCMKRHSEITDTTKKTFTEAFLKLNKEKPIEKITIKELAEVAGYNRTTFYNYFADVYSLFEYIEDFVFENIKGRLEENMRNFSNRDIFIRNVIEISSQWREYLLIILDNPYSYHFTVQLKGNLIAYWTNVFNLSENDLKISYRLDFYLSAVISVISRWLKNPDDMTAEEMANLLHEIVSKGILNGIVK